MDCHRIDRRRLLVYWRTSSNCYTVSELGRSTSGGVSKLTELDVLNQMLGAGANSVTILVGYILWRHDLRIRKLEDKQEKTAN